MDLYEIHITFDEALQDALDEGTVSPDDEVVLQKGPEGNGYHRLGALFSGLFDGESLYLRGLTSELERQGYTEEDVGSDEDEAVLVLQP